MRVLALVLIALSLAACAATGGSSITPSPDESPSDAASPTGAPSEGAPEGDPLTGVLGADSVEGGCGYLQAADGTKFQVIYPDGWELSLNPLELRAPDGDVVAVGGDTVTVIGEAAPDMASICMIGPIFRASAVEG